MSCFYSILTLLILGPNTVFAGPSEVLDSQLKAKAQSELQLQNVPVDTSEPLATVQVKLEPFQPKKAVLWGLDVGHNRLSVSGQTNLEFLKPQNLSEAEEFSLWYAKLSRFQLVNGSKYLRGWYTAGELGLGSTEPFASAESGLPIDDLRLQMIRARLNAGIETPLGFGNFSLVPQLSYGLINFTQVSSNSAARFSENQTTLAFAAFLQWQFRSGLLKAGYEQSSPQGSNLVRVSDQTWVFELGYRL